MKEKSDVKKVALVTGVSKGIGCKLAEELISKGWRVVGIARSEERLLQMAERYGNESFIPFTCDVSSPEMVQKVTKDLLETGVIPSLFFLNAGIAGNAAFEDVNDFNTAKHQEIFATNYFGVLYWVEEWLPICEKHQGANFIVTSSVNAFFAPPGGSAYSASKAAIAKAFEGLSLQYYNTNLKFSVVFAGPVKTEGLKGNLPFSWSPERMAKYIVTNAEKGKIHSENSLFYSLFARFMHALPPKFAIKILRK